MIDVVAGKTLSKGRGWWKAIVLVKPRFRNKDAHQLRLYAWQWSDKAKRWKQRQKFNFSGKSYIPHIVATLEAFQGRAASSGELAAISSLTKRIAQLEAELDTARLISAKNRIPDMERKVREFERLLDNKKTQERELQRFLHEDYWMFGARYRRVHREKWAGLKGRNDFMLEREIGYCDILELKRPRDPLFVGSRSPRMSAALKDAISQMALYLDYYYKHYLSHREQTQLDVLYPRGIIVIGRRRESEKPLFEAHKAIVAGRIELMTYDDVLNQAKVVIKTIKRRPRPPARVAA